MQIRNAHVGDGLVVLDTRKKCSGPAAVKKRRPGAPDCAAAHILTTTLYHRKIKRAKMKPARAPDDSAEV
jgi:hypothetical protein